MQSIDPYHVWGTDEEYETWISSQYQWQQLQLEEMYLEDIRQSDIMQLYVKDLTDKEYAQKFGELPF